MDTAANELIVYRASGLGNCIRALVARRLGYGEVVNEQLTLAAREGNMHEDAEIIRLREDGWTIAGQQHECRIDIIPGIAVVGHLDAAHIEWPKDDSPPMFLEVKSMGADTWKRFTKDQWNTPGFVQKYKWQLSAYMHGMGGRHCMFYAKNRNSGKTYTTIVRRPFYTIDDIRRRVLTAESWAMRDELPACDTDDKFICPFPYLHEQEKREELDSAREDELRGLCEQIVEAQARRDEADRDVKEMKGLLRERMGNPEKTTVKIPLGDDEITISAYHQGRKSFDEEKMRGDGIDPDRYKIEDLYPVLRVAKKKKKNEGSQDAASRSG